MPSKYRTLLKGDESLRGRGFITVLANQRSGGGEDGDEAPRVIRSNCGGTLAETISRLENALRPHRDAMRANALDPRYVRGDDADILKLSALKYVASIIMERGSLRYDEAILLACEQRKRLLITINDGLRRSGQIDQQLVMQDWQRAGHEILARLPVLSVPLGTLGPSGGKEQSLLMPIIPGMSDAELMMQFELVKEVQDARASANTPGEFDAAPLRLLLDALQPSARATVKYLILKTGGEKWGRELGMSGGEMSALVCRFNEVCSVKLPAAMREAEACVMANLMSKANVSEAELLRACSPRARLAAFRKTVTEQHVRRPPNTPVLLHCRLPLD